MQHLKGQKRREFMEGIIMSLKDMFKTHFETSDRAAEAVLQTRYYKNNYAQCKEATISSAKESGFTVGFEDDTRQELVLKRQDAEIIVSMVRISPIETAVDFTVNTSGVVSFGKGKKLIEALYAKLDKTLNLKGVALKR